MSRENTTPLWAVAETFTATVSDAGKAIQGRITNKGLLPVALVDSGSGSFGNFYSNDANPIARSAASKELGTIGFSYGLADATNDWEPLQSFIGDADIVSNDLDNVLGAIGFNFARDVATGNYTPMSSDGTDADAVAAVAKGPANVNGFNYVWNGATWDRVRGATIYKTVSATAAGETTVWQPTSGKKFRLMGYTMSIAGTIAVTGTNLIQLLDGTSGTVIKNHFATMTAVAPTGDTQLGADLGNGQLSAAANNILRVKLGQAVSGGGVAVNVWGTEE